MKRRRGGIPRNVFDRREWVGYPPYKHKPKDVCRAPDETKHKIKMESDTRPAMVEHERRTFFLAVSIWNKDRSAQTLNDVFETWCGYAAAREEWMRREKRS